MEVHREATPLTLGLPYAPLDHRRGQESPKAATRNRNAHFSELGNGEWKLDDVSALATNALEGSARVRDAVLPSPKGKHARRIPKPERDQDVVEPEALAVDAEVGRTVADRGFVGDVSEYVYGSLQVIRQQSRGEIRDELVAEA